MVNALRIHDSDNVVVALADLSMGMRIELADSASLEVESREVIPFGHKMAIVAIPDGEWVIKYGARIGVATEDIHVGQHVHVHNLRSVRGAAKL